MNIEEKNITLFENYLSNEMDVKSMQEFEAQLIYDSDFKNQFESFKSIERGIKEHYKTELKNKFSEIDVELDKKLSIKPNKNKVIWLSTAVAASIILGVFIYEYFSNQISLPQLAQENWIQDEGIPVKMSNKGKYDNAMNAYKLQKWDLALTELNKIKSDTASYYIALINFENREYQVSIKLLKKIKPNSTYFDEAQFRLALLYLIENKISFAREILQKQIKNNSIHSHSAKEILEKLKT
ncbi:MAG: hypothetical protein HYU67_11885 [Flavobacteriia bacterium]|nr:hypothetical protein [Flavobacteriia bacterium]